MDSSDLHNSTKTQTRILQFKLHAGLLHIACPKQQSKRSRCGYGGLTWKKPGISKGHKARMAPSHPKSQFYFLGLLDSRQFFKKRLGRAYFPRLSKIRGAPRLGVSPKLYMHRIASALVYLFPFGSMASIQYTDWVINCHPLDTYGNVEPENQPKIV